MPSVTELGDRVVPELPEAINEHHWLVETPHGQKEVIVLHSPRFRDIGVVADGQVVGRVEEEFADETRIEVPFTLDGRAVIVTIEKTEEGTQTLGWRLEDSFLYDVFVDGRSVVNGAALATERERYGVPLTRSGKGLLLILRMIPVAGMPGMFLGLTRGSGRIDIGVLTFAAATLVLLSFASYQAAARALRVRGWTPGRRLTTAVAASIAIWAVALGLVFAVIGLTRG